MGEEEVQNNPTQAVIKATETAQNPPEEEQDQEIEVEAEPQDEQQDEGQEAQTEEWKDKDSSWDNWGEDEWDGKDDKDEETAELATSVKNKVNQLNRSGKLCSEIDLTKVGDGLARLSEPIALQLLKDIFENADMVDKPNHLIGDACRKIQQSGRGAASEKVAHQIGFLMRRIRHINSSITLAYPLHMGNVLDILQPLHHLDAMQVLKKLVDQNESIDAPQSWLRREAKWIQDNPEESVANRKGGGKGKQQKEKAGGTIRAAPVTAYGKEGQASKWQKTGYDKGQEKKPWKDSKDGDSWGKDDSWGKEDGGWKKKWR